MKTTIRRNGNVEMAGIVIGTTGKNEHGAWWAKDTAGNVVSDRNHNRATAVLGLVRAVKAPARPTAEEKAAALDAELEAARADLAAAEAAAPTRNETRAANLAAITQEFRTVEVMTAEGTVYATAGFTRQDADGAVSQAVEITGGKVIGRIRRFGRDEFRAVDVAGNISETVIDQRAAMAILVLDAYAPEADAAEDAETVAAAEALTAATADRTAARTRLDRAQTAANRSASRAAMAATFAQQAAAEALDAGRDATRLALLIRPDADPAEVRDAADAAIAAAEAAANSAEAARGAAELAAIYAAEAVQDAPEAPQGSTDTPDAPQAVSGAPVAADGDTWRVYSPGSDADARRRQWENLESL